MDHFFVSSGPEDTDDPDRSGRPRRGPAADTDTAAPTDGPDRLRRLPLRPDGDRPVPDGDRRPRPRRAEDAPGEEGIGCAMRYRAERQLVPSGAALLLEVSEAEGEGLSPSGDGALLLAKGRYLLSFAADAEGAGDLGAVFALNGITLPYTSSLLPGENGARRIALTAVLNLTAAAILSVENNCGGEVAYANAVLTAVRLSRA